MTASKAIDKPILYTPRNDVRDAVRQELKALGASRIVTPASRDDCIKALFDDADAVLVIDWENGAEDVTQILAAIKGHFHIETRPSFLIAKEVADNIIATAYEYGVSQIHTGEISRTEIKAAIQELIEEYQATTTVRDILVQVSAARDKGDWIIATPLLADLHDKSPDHPRIAAEYAENLIHENNWSAARAVLEPLIEGDPPNVRALHLLGRCLLAQGDHNRAIGLLERAKIINPHNVDRLIELGNAFLNIDELDQAMENFNAAIRIDRINKDAKLGKGKCLLMNGEVNEALSLLKKISGPREMASIFNTAAVLSIRHDRVMKGMELYQSALAALGKNDRIASRLMVNMGLGYKKLEEFDKAQICFAKSLRLDPDYIKAKRQKEFVESKLGTAFVARASAAEDIKEPSQPEPGNQFDEETFIGEATSKEKTEITDASFGADLDDDDFDF